MVSGGAPKTAGAPKSVGATCVGCLTRHKKLPTSWTQNNGLFYCSSCWQRVQCATCKHHDPKGNPFRGSWQCRACRHQHCTRGPDSVQETCHRMIIEDHIEDCPVPLEAVVKFEDEATQEGQVEDPDDEDGGDEVAPLPVAGKAKGATTLRPPEERSHIVLLLDSSGSMRTVDVECKEAEAAAHDVARLDAATRCALEFVTAHARLHPSDLFSVATISDSATRVCEAVNADGVRKAFEATLFRGAGGTFYKPALEMAAGFLQARPDVAGHLVMLSDGRPADTKAALAYFQDLFVKGKYSTTRLHGIAFGAGVESYAPLQQLACISGGSFVLSGSSMRSLCEAFTSVSTSITALSRSSNSAAANPGAAPKRVARQVDFELPELGEFGKKGVLRFKASRWTFRYDGEAFHKQEWVGGPVERRLRPYMRGGMRLVFGYKDPEVVADGGWMVAKTSRFADAAFNSQTVVEAHAKSTAAARYYALLFNEQLKVLGAQLEQRPPAIIFVACFVCAVHPSCENTMLNLGEPKFFAAERYLPGVFLKYNSNNGYVNEGNIRHHDLVQAFLHFSFIKSGGTLVVADLQGVARQSEVLLTDPQVLSAGGGAYGPGDLGVRGIRACLAAHRCGSTCKMLGLKPISGPLLRKLEAASPPQRRAAPRAAPTSGSATSSGSWERPASQLGAGGPDWERVSEHDLTEIALTDGVRSSQASASSWVHLLDS